MPIRIPIISVKQAVAENNPIRVFISVVRYMGHPGMTDNLRIAMKRIGSLSPFQP